ncbi:MAG: trans-2-enoyl-CoA reductase family protein, partial [Candidatus Omnitrophica bacterium]|nr:trans-2-enoyl-CoA reductase family protein [Candidatus Omnitrophota bacterium]
MIIHPKVRGYICTTAHPKGCEKRVENEIRYIQSQRPITNGPKKTLVIGSSTGYGLSSRIAASFSGCKSKTIGVFFEKEPDQKRTATAGWYNSVAFEKFANQAGIYSKSFNGDAYSDEMKENVIKTIKKDLGSLDLVVYSLAAPRRAHPKTGNISKSVLRPIGKEYTNKSIDLNTNKLEEVTLPAATDEQIEQTVDVMGGEDWQIWMDLLLEENLLDKGIKTVAYSYVGPEVTRAIYRNGTIGRAKDHLEATAKKLDQKLQPLNGRAVISVNKALVTQSSSAIPFIPLYYILLSKVMKEKNIDENCVQQVYRLFS